MSEGGQSSTGQLIDFVITTHPAYPELLEIATQRNKDPFSVLEEKLQALCQDNGAVTVSEYARLTCTHKQRS